MSRPSPAVLAGLPLPDVPRERDGAGGGSPCPPDPGGSRADVVRNGAERAGHAPAPRRPLHDRGLLPDPPGVERGGGGTAPEPPRPGRRLPAARAPAAPEPPGGRPSGDRRARARLPVPSLAAGGLLGPPHAARSPAAGRVDMGLRARGLRAQRRHRGPVLRDVVVHAPIRQRRGRRPLDSRRTAGVSARSADRRPCPAGRHAPLAAGRTDAPRPDGRRGPVAWRVRKALGLRPAPG